MKKEFEIYSRNRNFCRFQKALCLFFRKEGLEVHSVLSEIKPEAASEVTVPVKVFFFGIFHISYYELSQNFETKKFSDASPNPNPRKKNRNQAHNFF